MIETKNGIENIVASLEKWQLKQNVTKFNSALISS
jgi:hypothetical protein